ncbi:hypothetical protein EVAR_63304_1 [Eumeta japonica]|uniref:Uncharacterized protein n=1 Tax=Eumeta variegata TaxID=151549 RepID=A0A4C1ZB35_EUMVA|nr:hypothetical protein EVAR_63304_1 [Eumeta japonica]
MDALPEEKVNGHRLPPTATVAFSPEEPPILKYIESIADGKLLKSSTVRDRKLHMEHAVLERYSSRWRICPGFLRIGSVTDSSIEIENGTGRQNQKPGP